MNSRPYGLADELSCYDDQVAPSVVKWSKRLQAQMKSHLFFSLDLIPIIIFWSAFKMACDMSSVLEQHAHWLLYFSMKAHAASALNNCIALRSKFLRREKESTVTSCCEAGKYYLETYPNNDVISESDTEVMHFTHPSNKSPPEYVQALWNK